MTTATDQMTAMMTPIIVLGMALTDTLWAKAINSPVATSLVIPRYVLSISPPLVLFGLRAICSPSKTNSVISNRITCASPLGCANEMKIALINGTMRTVRKV
jgi:hypothetical protein